MRVKSRECPVFTEVWYAVDGNEQALNTMVLRYQATVRGICRRKLERWPHLADDAAQAVFIILARKAGGLKGHKNVGGWLYRTSQFVCMGIIRSEVGKDNRTKEYREARGTEGESGEGRWNEVLPKLDEALADLPASQREVIMQHYYANVPFEDIAKQRNVSAGSIRMLATRARKKLKKKLEKKGVVLSLAALTTLLEKEAEAVQESGVRSQLSVGEASETARQLADSVLREMARQRALKVAGVVAAGAWCWRAALARL